MDFLYGLAAMVFLLLVVFALVRSSLARMAMVNKVALIFALAVLLILFSPVIPMLLLDGKITLAGTAGAAIIPLALVGWAWWWRRKFFLPTQEK